MKFNEDIWLWDLTDKEKREAVNILEEAVKLFRKDGWCIGHLKLTNGQDKFCAIGAIDEAGGTRWINRGLLDDAFGTSKYKGKTEWEARTPKKVYGALALLHNELWLSDEWAEARAERNRYPEEFNVPEILECESNIIEWNDHGSDDKTRVVNMFWKAVRRGKKELSSKELVLV